VCHELLLDVPPNILPCHFNSLLTTINHFCFKNEKMRNTGNVCRSQVSKPSNLMQKEKFSDVIFEIFLVFGVPQNFF